MCDSFGSWVAGPPKESKELNVTLLRNWARWHTPLIPATQKAEMGRSKVKTSGSFSKFRPPWAPLFKTRNRKAIKQRSEVCHKLWEEFTDYLMARVTPTQNYQIFKPPSTICSFLSTRVGGVKRQTIVQVALNSAILLPQPCKFRDYMYEPLYLASVFLLKSELVAVCYNVINQSSHWGYSN